MAIAVLDCAAGAHDWRRHPEDRDGIPCTVRQCLACGRVELAANHSPTRWVTEADWAAWASILPPVHPFSTKPPEERGNPMAEERTETQLEPPRDSWGRATNPAQHGPVEKTCAQCGKTETYGRSARFCRHCNSLLEKKRRAYVPVAERQQPEPGNGADKLPVISMGSGGVGEMMELAAATQGYVGQFEPATDTSEIEHLRVRVRVAESLARATVSATRILIEQLERGSIGGAVVASYQELLAGIERELYRE